MAAVFDVSLWAFSLKLLYYRPSIPCRPLGWLDRWSYLMHTIIVMGIGTIQYILITVRREPEKTWKSSKSEVEQKPSILLLYIPKHRGNVIIITTTTKIIILYTDVIILFNIFIYIYAYKTVHGDRMR